MGKTGNPASGETKFFLVNGDATPDPNVASGVIKEATWEQERLQKLSGTLQWEEINFGKTPVVANTTIYLVVKKYGSASNTFVFGYQTGTGSYQTSSDGVSWGAAATGDTKIRTFAAYPIALSVEDIETRKKYGVRERVFDFTHDSELDHAVEAFDLVTDVASLKKREYLPITVSIPDVRVDIAKYCRLKVKDVMDVKATIVGYDLEMNAHSETALGTDSMTLFLQEHRR